MRQTFPTPGQKRGKGSTDIGRRSHDRSRVIQALLELLQKRVEFTGDNFIILTFSHLSR